MKFKKGNICVIDLWKLCEYYFIRYFDSQLDINKILKDNPWLKEPLYIIKIDGYHYILKTEHTPTFTQPIEFIDYCFKLKKFNFIDLENDLF